MKKTLLKKIKALLTDQRQALVAAIVARHRTNQDGIDLEGDEVDYLQGRTIALVSNKLSDRDWLKLNQMDRAFKRMDEGTYGDCGECGEEIGEKRLQVMPWVELCVDCSEQQERARKQLAR